MYSIFKKLLDENKVKPADVARATGIPPSTFSDWKSGKSSPKQDKLDLIANYFRISPQVFKNPNPKGHCYDCGLNYIPDHAPDVRLHESTHKAWEEAVNKFGFCWTYAIRENAKAIARNKLLKEGLSLDESVELNIEIFKALFSRSLDSSNYSLDHVDFATYVSMLLNQKKFKNTIDEDSYRALVEKYGTLEGIEEGKTYYNVIKDSSKEESSYIENEAIAAHSDMNIRWTPKELRQIEEYKKLLLAARKNNDKT